MATSMDCVRTSQRKKPPVRYAIDLLKEALKTTSQTTRVDKQKEYQRKYREKRKAASDGYLEQEAKRKRLERSSQTNAQKDKCREQARIQQNYRARKKAEDDYIKKFKAATETPPSRKTSQCIEMENEKKKKNKEYMQRYRAGLSSQKNRRNNEKQLAYYHSTKKPKASSVNTPSHPPISQPLLENTPTDADEPSVQLSHPSSPFKSKAALYKACERYKKRFGRGKKSACLIKQLIRTADDDTKQHLNHLHVTVTSPQKTSTPQLISTPQIPQAPKSKCATKFFSENSISKSKPSRILRRKEKTATKSKIRNFYLDQSIPLPTTRTVSKKTGLQKQILDRSVKSVFMSFLTKYPKLKVKKSTFFKLRPKHVLSFKKRQFRQCLCETCQNVTLKLKVINSHLHMDQRIPDKYKLSNLLLCGNVTQNCLHFSCEDCGPTVFGLDLKSKLASKAQKLVKWERWEYVATETGKRKMCITHYGSLNNLLEEFITDLKFTLFSKHLHVAINQRSQFSTITEKPPSNWGVAVIDYAENYQCAVQNEAQSTYYSYSQVTIFPCVIYYTCNCCQKRVTDYKVFISDDLNHDAFFADHVLLYLCKYLADIGCHHLVLFSDGAPNQFKFKLPVKLLQELSLIISIERCYFGSSHGKNPCDACGGIVKNAVLDAVKSQELNILCAYDFFQYCHEHLSLPSEHVTHPLIKRKFVFVSSGEVNKLRNKEQNAIAIPGIRTLHSLKYVSNSLLFTRNLTCFCQFCLRDDFSNCDNTKFVDNRKLIQMDSSIPTSVAKESRVQFFTHLQHELSSCQTFSALLSVCSANEAKVSSHELNCKDLYMDVCDIDAMAERLLSDDVKVFKLKPRSIVPDGNCLPRSISFLLFGHEDARVEMRC